MKQVLLSFLLLNIFLNCNNSEGRKNRNNNLQNKEYLQPKVNVDNNVNDCDTIKILKNLKNQLLNQQTNNIAGYENIPRYLVDFYKNKESNEIDNDSINKQDFKENYKYIFSDDFLHGLSMINVENLKNKGRFNIANIQSYNFTPNVKYDYNVNYKGTIMEISILYKFPSDDDSLDSETSIIYVFKFVDCKMVIDKVIMAG